MSTSKKSNPDEIIWEVDDDKKSWWKKRSGLEKKLVISFGITVVVFIGIFIYMGLKPSAVQEEVVCSTAECLVSASQIINLIDTKTDPCDDFYHFACHKLMKDTIEEEITEEIIELLQEPISSSDNSMVKSQKTLYQSCMNEEELGEESLPVIQNLIRDLREWPVVLGHRWYEKHYDWADTVIKLRKKGFKDSMILRVDVYNTNDKVEIMVYPPTIDEVKREHSELYIKFMSDIARMFGAEGNRTIMEIEKVYDFREKLQEITDKFWKFNTTRVTISDFQEEYDDIDWFKFIYNFVSPHKIGSRDYVRFPNADFMDAFTLLMSKTPQRIQANYIIWSVVESLMPFLPKSYRELQNNYTCALNKEFKTEKRPEFCHEVLRDLFVPVPAHIQYMRSHLTEEKREKILQVFESIKSQTMDFIEEAQWINNSDKEIFTAVVNETSVVVGIKGDYLDDSIFEKLSFGQNKYSYGGSFLSMYLNQKRQVRDAMLRNIGKKGTDTVDLIIFTEPIALSNEIILPIGMMSRLFYEPEGPMYLTYGTFGKTIAKEIMNVIVDQCRDQPISNSSIKRYEEIMKCVNKDFTIESETEDLREYVNYGAYANIISNKIAYDAYQKWVEKNGEEPVPVGIDYTTNQLFWIAALADQCYEKKDFFYLQFQELYEKNIPVIYDENFVNDFGCSAGSKMNPSEKCDMQ